MSEQICASLKKVNKSEVSSLCGLLVVQVQDHLELIEPLSIHSYIGMMRCCLMSAVYFVDWSWRRMIPVVFLFLLCILVAITLGSVST